MKQPYLLFAAAIIATAAAKLGVCTDRGLFAQLWRYCSPCLYRSPGSARRSPKADRRTGQGVTRRRCEMKEALATVMGIEGGASFLGDVYLHGRHV